MAENARNEYLTLRARLIQNGISLAGWAKAHGLPVGTVYKAANGTRSGKRSQAIRARLEKAAA